MTAATDYFESQVGNHLLRSAAWAKPANNYIGLFTTAPTGDDGTGAVEVSGGSYARVAVPVADAQWNETESGLFLNAADIEFPAPTGNWGQIIAFGVFDSETGGQLLLWSNLGASKTLSSGDPPPRFTVGSLSIRVK